eukprot:gene14854-biopygen20142
MGGLRDSPALHPHVCLVLCLPCPLRVARLTTQYREQYREHRRWAGGENCGGHCIICCLGPTIQGHARSYRMESCSCQILIADRGSQVDA